MSQNFRSRMKFTGYLHREALSEGETPEQPYVLVTPGGGGDGAGMVDLVLSAYEQDPDLSPRAVLVYGPFLSGEVRAEFEARVAKLNGRVQAVGFDSRMETLMKGAMGIVSMGGYNTFCEVLSFDKPVVIVPRTRPRMEQHIRASPCREPWPRAHVGRATRRVHATGDDCCHSRVAGSAKTKPRLCARSAGRVGRGLRTYFGDAWHCPISRRCMTSERPKVAVVVKGWPRLSETFIAQEIVALEETGYDLSMWSLRFPTDKKRHPLHERLQAPVHYLPEYLHHEPLRVFKGVLSGLFKPRFWTAMGAWLKDLRRDVTRNRVRRFGQACVLARELPGDIDLLYAHFMHTPASVTRLRGDHARHAVVGVGPCQGYLDLTRVGKAREAARQYLWRGISGDLYQSWRGSLGRVGG